MQVISLEGKPESKIAQRTHTLTRCTVDTVVGVCCHDKTRESGLFQLTEKLYITYCNLYLFFSIGHTKIEHERYGYIRSRHNNSG